MPIRYLFFDVGYTLVDENAVWEARCREQAEMPEARALGLTAGDIYREIEEASRQYLPQYRAVVKNSALPKPRLSAASWKPCTRKRQPCWPLYRKNTAWA